MKEFIKKLLFALISIPNCIVKRTNWYNNLFPLDKNNYPTNEWYRNHIERNYDVVNVGSSSAVYAFDYADESIKAFNWASEPQSLEFSFKVLKNFYSILRKNGIVIIPFSPFSALSVTGKWSDNTYLKYVGILDPALIDNYSILRKKKEYPLLYMPKMAIKSIIKDESLRKKEILRSISEIDQFENDANRWIDSWCREFSISSLEDPLHYKNILGRRQRLITTQEMLDFCYERNLRPILVITPMHPSLSSKFSETFRENYIYSFIRELKYNNLTFLNYMDDQRFAKTEQYINSFFMSKEGAQAFTHQLLIDIGVIKF